MSLTSYRAAPPRDNGCFVPQRALIWVLGDYREEGIYVRLADLAATYSSMP